MAIDNEFDVSPKSLKEIEEKIFIIPIEMIAATIIKGIDNKIALINFLGSFIGTHPLLIRSKCKRGLLFGNLFNIFIKIPRSYLNSRKFVTTLPLKFNEHPLHSLLHFNINIQFPKRFYSKIQHFCMEPRGRFSWFFLLLNVSMISLLATTTITRKPIYQIPEEIKAIRTVPMFSTQKGVPLKVILLGHPHIFS